MPCPRIPEPLAGGIRAGGGRPAAAPAEDRHHECAQRTGEASRAEHADGEGHGRAARLRVLVLGAGLIGSALAKALALQGHDPLLVSRRPDATAGTPGIDFGALPDDRALLDMLAGVDVLVNTVGIFREPADQSFDAVHVKGPLALFDAARRAGVRRIVQLSALGAAPASPLPYFSSKGRAERLLREIGIDHAIVRPSLVFAPAGTSTRWFAQLASLPLLPLPGGGTQHVQPLHLDDLVDALVRLVEAQSVPDSLDAVGPRPLPLHRYLDLFRRAMGVPGTSVPVPRAVARLGAAALGKVSPGLPVNADALAMLDAGNTADPVPFAQWLGRAARDPAAFVAAAADLRWPSLLGWSVPLMRLALAAMWIATGIVSLWQYPREASLALLAEVGPRGAVADVALVTAALLDIALGIGLLVRRWRQPVYLAQLLLVLGYTVIITLWLPAQWLHPFGPVLKNLPLLAMILALWALDRKPWT